MKKINFRKRRSFKFSIEFVYEPNKGVAFGFEFNTFYKEFSIAFLFFGITISKS